MAASPAVQRGVVVAGLVAAAASGIAVNAAPQKPAVIMTVLIDDLGYADTQLHNPRTPTPHLGALAAEGIILENHHVYRYCSPTRRSILSGRFPVHISGDQAPVCSDYLPLQMTLLPAKLKAAGYETAMIGKGHLSYLTTDHLPIARGFDEHFGYLNAAENYEHGLAEICDVPELEGLPAEPKKRQSHGQWPPNAPSANGMDPCQHDMWSQDSGASPEVLDALKYSTTTFGELAVKRIMAATAPLYMHLTWQAVHGPYVMPDVPENQKLGPSDPLYDNYCHADNANGTEKVRCDFGSMLKVVDAGMGNVTAALRAKNLWENTLMIVSSDNGGIGPGNNYPLRGTKMTPWQGGTRVMAMITGGVVPAHLQGTRNFATLHVADWYPTLANLVGVDPSDTVSVWGIPRPIDGVDIWDVLMQNKTVGPHTYLPTTEYSIIWNERWKLYTNAGRTGWFPPERGWNSTQIPASTTAWPCVGPTNPFISNGGCAICSHEKPCLFDLQKDPTERNNLAASNPTIVSQLATELSKYTEYVNGTMEPTKKAQYDCIDPSTLHRPWPQQFPLHPWYGNFSGPCCRPKSVL